MVGTKIRHRVTGRRGVVHALCPNAPHTVLVRYGKETRPTQVPIADIQVRVAPTGR